MDPNLRGNRLALLRALAAHDTRRAWDAHQIGEQELGFERVEAREATRFLLDRKYVDQQGTGGMVRIARAGLDVLEQLDEQEREQAVAEPSRNPKKVFIIYGRNQKAFEAARDFLRALGLTPSDFNKMVAEAGGSPYVGQVIVDNMRTSQAVVALFTPDEHASLRSDYHGGHDRPEDKQRWQARPNVIFEAGMAMGIDEKRTIIVTLGATSLLSDMGGRHVLRMSNGVNARDDLKARLKSAGCQIEEQSDWHSAGDFDAAVAGLSYDAPAPARPQPPPERAPPAAVSDEAAIMKLVQWLETKEQTNVAGGSPVEFAIIDTEASLPPGTAERLIGHRDVLGERWSELKRGGGFIRLEQGPAHVRDVLRRR